MGQALFFDIDGTIISEKTMKVPESARRALEAAREKGHLIFINTGRTICSLPPEIMEIPFDGFLCGCGIYLTYHNEVIYETHLPEEEAVAIAEMAMKCRIDGVFEGVEDVYFSSQISRFESIENMKRYMYEHGLGREKYLEEGYCPYDKLYVVTDELSDKKSFFCFVSDTVDVIDRGDGAYECVPKGFSKATAIELILNKFGMTKKQSYVFGDSSNDLPMFQYAGHAIAMGEHDPVLDPYAEFVTKTVEEDGIEFALKRYGLI